MSLLARFLRSLGPGLVTACVVIGPGSILTASKVGSEHGYSRGWVVLLSAIFMLCYMTLGARLGVVTQRSALDLLRERRASWLAILIGLGVFFICACYQFGNNLGVHAALAQYFEFRYSIVVFNMASLIFLFGFRDFYRALEILMSVFVGVMLLAFAVNLAFARPDFQQFAVGMLPPWRREGLAGLTDISLLGLVGTTFVIPAAFFQSYLVRYKGWKKDQLGDGMFDARVGTLIMLSITLMIMSTSAAVLRGKDIIDIGSIATQLEPLFGPLGKLLFCIGLISAAYSSFLINSMVGGYILSDALGLGCGRDDPWPKRITALILISGMGVALWVIETKQSPVAAIVTAQAFTVVAAPLTALAMWWLTASKSVMGEDRNGLPENVLAGCGFVMLCAIAGYIAAFKIAPTIQAMF